MPSSVTYSCELDVDRETVLYLSAPLAAERRRRRTRRGRRALGCFVQAVLVLRWFVDGTRIEQMAADNQISGKTVYRYLHEAMCSPHTHLTCMKLWRKRRGPACRT